MLRRLNLLEILMPITYALLVIFVGFYVAYYAVCRFYIRKKNHGTQGNLNDNHPKVSIILPVYNEVNVLKRRIENFNELNYPKDKLELVFVDGGSDDGSIDLLKDLKKQSDLSIKLIFQGQRNGFNNAVREGFAKTTGEIICITGAETEYDSKALNMMVRHFKDPKIGAVTGKQIVKNIDDGLSPQIEIAYRELYDFMREGESCLDSPFDIKGEITAARRDIVKALVENSRLKRAGCIDCCVNFQGKLDGFKTVYDPDAFYSELSPKLMRDSFKQQVRRAATLIENMMAFKKILFNRKYGAFGLFIMPAHFLMLIVFPYLLILLAAFVIISTVINPTNLFLLAILVTGLASLLVSKKIKAFVKSQLALIVATFKLLKGVETQKFERIESARP